MTTIQDLFNAALKDHQAGRLMDARRRYGQVLAAAPRHADSLHLLGLVAFQSGNHDAAIELMGKAVEANPKAASYHSNLGNVFKALGRLDDAVSCYRRALDLQPDFADAHANLGIAFLDAGAAEDAVACLRKALDLAPRNAKAYNNLGIALRETGQLTEAIACVEKALALKPDYPEAQTNLGVILRDAGRLDQAVLCHRRALDLDPLCVEAHTSLGIALLEQAKTDEAIERHRRAIELRPDHPDAHKNLGIALLTRGDLVAGWEDYEWRWKTAGMMKLRRDFAQPQWRGEMAEGRTLLIHAEQGFGDIIQFCRYAPLAAARGLRVIVEVPRPLVRLLRQSLPGIDRVVERGQELPPFDLHCPMLSTARAFGTTVTTIPRAASYLKVSEALLSTWRTRLAAHPNRGRRVGVVWAGNPFTHAPTLAARDRRRSIAPELLAPWFGIKGLAFFSLQKNGTPAPQDVPLTDFMGEMTDFADTAALISNLDLVISVDTAVAHLAAALGKPVWLLNRFDTCWRWLLQREDSPWYPTLRQFRQVAPGAWPAVIDRVATELRDFANGR